jgi:hypothetical protein
MLFLAVALQVTTTCNRLFDTVTCRSYGGPTVLVTEPTAPRSRKRYGHDVPQAKDLYIGCALAEKGEDVPVGVDDVAPFSAAKCLLIAGVAVQSAEKQGAKCLPTAAEMPRAYRAVYDLLPASAHNGDAMQLMVAAVSYRCGEKGTPN